MHTIPDLRREDEVAVRATVALVERIRAEDLVRPTPCAGWDVGALLAHMSAQHRGFAASATGRGASMDVWRVAPTGADPVAEYVRASEEVIAAFGPDAVLTDPFPLPEFGQGVQVPGRQAISFHFVDYVVHGWDIARSLDLPFDLPAEVLRAALPVAEAVPDGAERLAPGAAFAPGLPVADHGDPLTRILALLGRRPTWPH